MNLMKYKDNIVIVAGALNLFVRRFAAIRVEQFERRRTYMDDIDNNMYQCLQIKLK